MKNKLFAIFSLFALLSNIASGAVLNLSNNGANPTQLNFTAGENIVEVRLDPTSGADSRFFTFNIANGYQLDTIQLDAFSYTQIASNPIATGVAFFGLKKGTTISPNNNNPTVVDGYALLGKPVNNNPINGVIPTDVGGNVYTSLIATGAFTGNQLPNALGTGAYTVWLRESRTIDEFSLNFKVAAVPLPGAVWLMGSVLMTFWGCGIRKKFV